MEQRRKRHKASHLSHPRSTSSPLTFPLTRSHPLHVQPLGNLYLSSNPHNPLPPGLGLLYPLLAPPSPTPLLSYFDPIDLARLSLLSHALYVLTRDDEVHRALVLQLFPSGFSFIHSWRITLIHHTLLLTSPSSSSPPALSPVITRLLSSPPPITRPLYSDHLFQSFLCSSLDLSHFSNPPNIDRLPHASLTPLHFLTHYAIPNRPLLITHSTTHWPASSWTPDLLSSLYPTSPFRVGAHHLTLPQYLAYSRAQHDESPLYLFDSGFGDRHPELVQAYEAPHVFGDDLFALLEGVPASEGYQDGCEDRGTPDAHMRGAGGGWRGGGRGGGGRRGGVVVVEEDEKKEASTQGGGGCMRPAYRWILLGPARSGSTFHKVSCRFTHTTHACMQPPALPFLSVECPPSSSARPGRVRQWRCVQPGRARSAIRATGKLAANDRQRRSQPVALPAKRDPHPPPLLHHQHSTPQPHSSFPLYPSADGLPLLPFPRVRTPTRRPRGTRC